MKTQTQKWHDPSSLVGCDDAKLNELEDLGEIQGFNSMAAKFRREMAKRYAGCNGDPVTRRHLALVAKQNAAAEQKAIA